MTSSRTEAEPGHEQQHRIVPGTVPVIVADRREHGLDAIGRQVARQSRAPALGRLRHAQRQICRRRPAPNRY